ncbi:hypothetical protein EGW08_020957 [Elysia chlorotica]|uniref:MAM domain-containing protein n=1 Tax=Elysia chlorotica TaxID=188477 RepID=A0A3S1AZM4_ELYCH|nr:hypothetical protein EGW08_020957 [Elysia chlorotica]
MLQLDKKEESIHEFEAQLRHFRTASATVVVQFIPDIKCQTIALAASARTKNASAAPPKGTSRTNASAKAQVETSRKIPCPANKSDLGCVMSDRIDVWSCDFEQDCSYEQEKYDQFDWSKNSGETATSSTGPDFDHTVQNINGHYMYIETSGFASQGISSSKNEGDTAILRTSDIPRIPGCTYRLVFWYSMYGRGTGSLTVKVCACLWLWLFMWLFMCLCMWMWL